MNISKKDIDQNNAIISISIDKADYADKVEKSLRNYRKKAQMPGFRPGMVPLGLVKKMYGKAVLAEEINNLVAENLEQYIKENNLHILGQPLPSESEKTEIDFETQEAFDFHFDIGLAPEFDVTLTQKNKVPFYEIAISDDMIDNQIKSHASRYGKYEQVDTVEAKDMVKGKIWELENNQPKENGINANDAVLIPDYIKIEDQKALFIGKKVGDKVIFNPALAYENETEISSLLKTSKEAVKDLKSDFEFEIQGITRYTNSEIDQTLFDKVFGEGTIKSEEEFKAKISENIRQQLEQDSEYRFGIDARQMVINKYKDLSFPKAFLKRWLLENNENMTAEKIEEDYPKMIEDLIWHIVKDKIADANGIKVETTDVEEYAKKVAKSQFAQYGMWDIDEATLTNYAKDMMKTPDTLRHFFDRAQEDKVLEFIRTKVKLDKKAIGIDEFNKLFTNDKA